MLHLFSLFSPHAPRINPCRIEDASLLCGLFSLGTMMWVGIGTAVVGAGTTLYGVNAQKKANQSAQNANEAAQEKQNDFAWNSWLISKGIQPNSPLKAGQMPTAGGYSAVNTKLPLWANVTYGTTALGSTGGGLRLVKKGAPRTTGISGLAPMVTTPAVEPVAEGAGVNEPSRGSKIINNALDPLNLMGSEPRTIKNTAKRVLDPLGFFG